MKILMQRVSQAQVVVGGEVIAKIQRGLLVFVCAQSGDDSALVDTVISKISKMRIFADASGKMNLSVQDQCGGVLLVPQFTLAADVTRGTRPSFTEAAHPSIAEPLFIYAKQALALALEQGVLGEIGFGKFGADMQVSLTNDGPITIGFEMKVKTV